MLIEKIRSKINLLPIGLIGLIFTAIAFYYPYQLKKSEVKIEFEKASHHVIGDLKETIHNAMQVVLAMQSFYNASSYVSREEYKTFTDPLLKQNPLIAAIEWAPRVTNHNRLEYEEQAQKISPNFTFTESDIEGKLIKATDRAVYYPVFYVEPFFENRTIWGYDLASSPSRKRVLLKALKSNSLVTTEGIQLFQKQHHREGFLAILPVYNQDAQINTFNKKQANLKGFVLGVLSFDELFDALEKNISHEEISIELFINEKYSYSYTPNKSQKKSFRYKESTKVGDKNWTFVCYPTIKGFAYSPPFVSYLLAFTGILTTAVVIIYLNTLTRRTEKINLLVNSRTEELELARKSAEQANALKSKYLAVLSHEIKNPLNAILGIAKTLTEEVNDNQKESINHIISSGEHLLEAINTTVNLTKIEADKIEFLPERVELSEVIQDCIDMNALSADKKGLAINFEGKKIECITDPQKVRQVMINLISNAIKYTQSGSITITVTTEPKYLHIAVQDTGRGIDQNLQEQIFDPYQQAGENLDEKYVGTGLGLWISKKLIEACQGSIKVESEKEVGSTFTVTLPLNPGSK
ncbi:MAG: Sensor histidine kinase RcsC [Chlamydiia bacterium]|nr:Sensor histidine kinase RcsC [Chlamydiia bacterium]MCH9616055.1 Sensor histidine kinase RcsC [Chlamydiia bacterium]MCH9629078.1 Sensor histidine kinase RcsC [Chlamydiia bacterium]